jgi:hypothetical protein
MFCDDLELIHANDNPKKFIQEILKDFKNWKLMVLVKNRAN